jgi:hypothetical protein
MIFIDRSLTRFQHCYMEPDLISTSLAWWTPNGPLKVDTAKLAASRASALVMYRFADVEAATLGSQMAR